MKPPVKSFADLKKGQAPKSAKAVSDTTYAPPTPKVARRPPAKVLTPAEKAAFLASRPDLKPKA